jgi:glycolate oxidase iron-sulfur subunit
VRFEEQDICCGSAGIYNLVEPDAAQALGDRKIALIDAVQPDVVATANPGCTLQMAAAARRRGRTLTIRHPIELVDASIRG